MKNNASLASLYESIKLYLLLCLSCLRLSWTILEQNNRARVWQTCQHFASQPVQGNKFHVGRGSNLKVCLLTFIWFPLHIFCNFVKDHMDTLNELSHTILKHYLKLVHIFSHRPFCALNSTFLKSHIIKTYYKYCSKLNRNGTSRVQVTLDAVQAFFSVKRMHLNAYCILTGNAMQQGSLPILIIEFAWFFCLVPTVTDSFSLRRSLPAEAQKNKISIGNYFDKTQPKRLI